MKYWFRKTFLIIVLMTMGTVSVAQEVPSIFSHTVLKLPFDLQSEEPWSRIIRTQEEWTLFYNELVGDTLATDDAAVFAIPEIDFETYQIVTGGIGFRSSGGYRVSVEKVHELSDVIYIDVIVVSPGPNCASTDATTYPSTTVLIKKTNKPIQFFSAHTLNECLF